MRVFALVLTLLMPVSGQAQEITYHRPGDILPGTVSGIEHRTVHFPDWQFPMLVGTHTGRHAYMGTQLSKYHGLDWSNDPRLFSYPHRDNQCEPRRWKVNACPAGKGHQGVDIRAHDRSDNTWDVVAVQAGVVTSVTSSTAVIVRSGTTSVRYLHMHPGSIKSAGIKPGVRVQKGQKLGKVSCILGGKCQTSQHLHLDAHAGVSTAGNFFHVYPSLIAAYRRAWDLPDGVQDGQLTVDSDRELDVVPNGSQPLVTPTLPAASLCDAVALAAPLERVDPTTFSSLWRHNCSVMGLVANTQTGARAFVYYRPKVSIANLVENEPTLFQGTSEGGHYKGQANVYSSKCGVAVYNVSGPVTQPDATPLVTVMGKKPQRDKDCVLLGAKADTLQFVYLGEVDLPVPSPAAEPRTDEDRTTLTERTRNFMAITFYPDAEGKINVLPYVAEFPGTAETGALKDSKDGLIPAMKTDEAGVAISWTWIRKRALHVSGLATTPREVAHSIAGVDPSVCDHAAKPTAAALQNLGTATATKYCDAVSAYLGGYVGFANGRNFAADYFGRTLDPDEPLNLARPEVAFAWLRTMYSHESGKPALVSKDVFERGRVMGEDWIKLHYDGQSDALKDVAYYSDPCNFNQSGCATLAGAEPATLPDILETLKRLEARIIELENQ